MSKGDYWSIMFAALMPSHPQKDGPKNVSQQIFDKNMFYNVNFRK